MGAIHRLRHLKASKLSQPGIYEDGGGLRLVIGARTAKRWVVRVTIQGRRKERGLGSFPTVSLEETRSRAADFRSHAKQGRDLLSSCSACHGEGRALSGRDARRTSM